MLHCSGAFVRLFTLGYTWAGHKLSSWSFSSSPFQWRIAPMAIGHKNEKSMCTTVRQVVFLEAPRCYIFCSNIDASEMHICCLDGILYSM